MGEEIREFACCVTVVSAARIWLSERHAGAGQRLDQAEMNGSEASLWSSWFPVGLTRAMSVKGSQRPISTCQAAPSSSPP
jgi:hypothetical protein